MGRSLRLLFGVALLTASPAHAQPPSSGLMSPLHQVLDMTLGESVRVKVPRPSAGSETVETVTISLKKLEETRDAFRSAVREARVTLEVDGTAVAIVAGNYQLPKTIGKVQLDCTITSGY